MGPVRRALRLALASAAALPALAVAQATIDAPVVEAAPDDIIAIVIAGTGNGHGRGMSQWGAYGYAVDHGWTWQEILAHYYGGTDSGTTPAGQRIAVRLTDYDGMGEVGVISHGSPVRWETHSGASMRAVETSAGVFDIYSSPQIACPGTSSLTVPDGPVVQASGYNASAVLVQRFLKTFHDSSIVVDGYFGNQTNGVLASWQSDEGLPVDGTTWNQDDATRARAIIDASGSAVSWTKVGTHTQSAGDPVRFTSTDGENTSTDRGDVLGVCSTTGAINHYRGAIEVLSSSDGNRVVSDVNIEGYVRGVIPKEVAASWAYAGDGAGENAVRAQAVAARSYGLEQSRSYTYPGSSTQYATTCDTTACQVYGGSATRSSATGSITSVEHEATDAAVLATANVVRKWPSGHSQAGQIVSTEFSASNGPRTAGGAFPPVNDIGDSTPLNPYHRWTRIIDADTFAAANGLGQITGASMQPTTASNYQGFDGIWFDDIVITGTAGTYRQQAWDFRNAMGYRSPGMTVRVIRESTTSKSMAFIGDSVGNGITASNAEFVKVTDGTFSSQTIDAVDSRCTTNESCPGSTGVTVANELPNGLDLVMVELGYNDNPATFADDIDAMMTALSAKNVGSVAWVNMADIRTSGGELFYTQSNAALAAAANEWPNLTVLDWDAASDTAERPRWFASDGVHLSTTGEAEFALWLRDQLVDLAPSHYLSPPRRIELPVVGTSMTSPDGQTVTIPDDAAGVSLNVTMVRPAQGGYATVWPCQQDRPEVSSLNARTGEVIANNVIAPISEAGTVCFYSSVGTDFLVDIAGYFPGAPSADPAAAPPFVGLLPERRVDTRLGIGGQSAEVTPTAPLVIPVAGVAAQLPDGSEVAVPVDVVAVAVNVTIAQASTAGYATVWPCSTERPDTSNVNFESGNPTGNGVVAPVGLEGNICVYTSAPAHVLVDLVGHFGARPLSPTPGDLSDTPPAFTSAFPTRLVDTRNEVGGPAGRIVPNEPLRVQMIGRDLKSDPEIGGAGEQIIPDDASAVAMNLTAVGPSSSGFATVWPCSSSRPTASNLNFVAGQNRANSVIAPIGEDGEICVYVSASANIIVDVTGWFIAGDGAGFVGAVPERLVDTRVAVGPVPS